MTISDDELSNSRLTDTELNDTELNDTELNDIELNDELNDELSDELSDEDFLSDDTEKDTDFEIMFKNTANKHKQEGTHALKRDTIFKGKKENPDEPQQSTDFYNDSYRLEDYDTHHSEDLEYKKNLTKDIYKILEEKTEIDFLANRRKPNKKTFNMFYEMCLDNLDMNYTKSEIFVELSYYFTDNIFNMFKLLNKKNAYGIILELKNKGYLSGIGNIDFV